MGRPKGLWAESSTSLKPMKKSSKSLLHGLRKGFAKSLSKGGLGGVLPKSLGSLWEVLRLAFVEGETKVLQVRLF